MTCNLNRVSALIRVKSEPISTSARRRTPAQRLSNKSPFNHAAYETLLTTVIAPSYYTRLVLHRKLNCNCALREMLNGPFFLDCTLCRRMLVRLIGTAWCLWQLLHINWIVFSVRAQFMLSLKWLFRLGVYLLCVWFIECVHKFCGSFGASYWDRFVTLSCWC